MRKSVLVALLLFLAFIISIFVGYFISSIKNKDDKKYLAESKLAEENNSEVITTSGAENVVSPNDEEEEVDNKIKYTLKEYNGCIAVYRIDEGKEPIFEDTTDILTKYLSEEDLIQIKNGIIVEGVSELKHLLEDLEQ